MNSLLLSLVLVGGAPEHLTCPQDGTLIFLENSKKVVEKMTQSGVTHVAIVMNVSGEPYVYEAEPPKVRRVPLMTFYREIGERNRDDEEIRIWLLPPVEAYTERQCAKMNSYLESQLGRRYSIKNYVRDVQGDGIHCAELTANALNRSGQLSYSKCQSLSPGAVVSNCGPTYKVATEALVSLSDDEEEESWCERSSAWWGNAWKWCKWSSGECWTWCRN